MKRGDKVPIIEEKTYIELPIEDCFNAARNPIFLTNSIPKHKRIKVNSSLKNNLKISDKVYLEHSFLKGKIRTTSKFKVTELVPPYKFTEEIESLFFKDFRHTHTFSQKDEKGTLMKDTIEYNLRFGILGKLLNTRFLKKYLKRYLYLRIKKVYEKSVDYRTAPR